MRDRGWIRQMGWLILVFGLIYPLLLVLGSIGVALLIRRVVMP